MNNYDLHLINRNIAIVDVNNESCLMILLAKRENLLLQEKQDLMSSLDNN